ncbi:esterase/lipase family protein [Planosporangium mesophilum]|uniref:Alpha/beta hydrolase n=1 Tax=Planosporangium mesophilum TaxID=689768 RepID=A0A8J3TGC4_9ACTN|nr:hypothetical protein [Planosporangium mesophilum]NJC85932.1 hypothetical protein [Planosporangium mesophilum]GII25016.1 hypothetical protein Pme01_46130 [Planosporangium mesophilum]
MGNRLPIIYVRGYAGGTSGIDAQVDDPFYGFNGGSTHVRVDGDGVPRYYQFESPLLRLMLDEGYQLFVRGGQQAFLEACADGGGDVGPATIWIYRFYDRSATTFGQVPVAFDLEKAATQLLDFVNLVRRKTGAPRVNLVAHSMGGLLCRSMLQRACPAAAPAERDPGNPAATPEDATPENYAASIVDKLFTYGTPHGGISFQAGGGLLDWAMEVFGPNGADIFSPPVMYTYLTPGESNGGPPDGWDPRDLVGFPPGRVFCLIGTDPGDYGAGFGLSAKVVGARSDGLVQIDNAYVRGAHRAFVHRSHSGRYGEVNSEEGYQNLRRFLFGRYQVRIDLCDFSLPRDPDAENSTWQAEVRLSVRGLPILMHEQSAAHYCPVQLDREVVRHSDTPDTPVPLITAFLLDPARAGVTTGTTGSRRARYALGLRVLRLQEHHDTFLWGDHLEQIPEWEDTLIADVGTDDAAPDASVGTWAAWNSDVRQTIAATDPISAEPLKFSEDGGTLIASVPLPPSGRYLFGDHARLRMTVSQWG